MNRITIAALICTVLIAAVAYPILRASRENAAMGNTDTVGTDIQVIDGLAITYIATPALFDKLGLHPRRDFGVAVNGNVVMNTDEGVFEIETRDQELAAGKLHDAPLDALALDGGAVTLGIRNRFFGQLGTDGFDKAFPLPEGELRLAASIRPGWVYLFRNEPSGASWLYGVWDNGTLSTLVEFQTHIRAVADDERTTFVATDDGLLAVDERKVSVISKVTPDLGPAHALAAGSGRLFIAANKRVYLLTDRTLLAIARGITPELVLAGDRLYCWDHGRRLLLIIDVGPLFADT